MHFILPIELGHVVILKACVNCVHETSMEIGVRVEREDASTGTIDHAATAYLTFVAMDEEMKPVRVPNLDATTEAELRRVGEAHLRRESRLKHRQALLARRQRKT
jgi:acyl-CoA hydrolase